jgi:hypothetical protein
MLSSGVITIYYLDAASHPAFWVGLTDVDIVKAVPED